MNFPIQNTVIPAEYADYVWLVFPAAYLILIVVGSLARWIMDKCGIPSCPNPEYY